MRRPLKNVEKALVICPLAVFIFLWLFQWWPRRVVEAWTGEYPTVEKGKQASIQRLSQLIMEKPRSSFYAVHWQLHGTQYWTSFHAGDNQLEWGEFLDYDAHVRMHASHKNPPESYMWKYVTKAKIHSIAEKHGTIGDLRTLGCMESKQ